MQYFFEQKKKQKRRNKVVPFLILSIIFHILLFTLLVKIVLDSKREIQKPQVVFIDTKQIDKLLKAHEQFAETETANNRTPPKDAKYLSEHNQSVTEETKASNNAPFTKQQKGGNAGKQMDIKQLVPEPEGLMAKTEAANNLQSQAASTLDHLNDVKDGAQTLLNSKEFIYYGFYHRLSQQLGQIWYQKVRELYLRNYGDGVHGFRRDYVTYLMVTLDKDGYIHSIQIIEASGLRDLDQTAIDAFNEGAPYPNPPKGMIDADGLARVPIGFYVENQG